MSYDQPCHGVNVASVATLRSLIKEAIALDAKRRFAR